MLRALSIVLFACLLFFASCRKDGLPGGGGSDDFFYQPHVPEGWPAPAYSFAGNDVSYDGFMLGRHLFYEPMLSKDSSISCGSCHQQIFAFSNGPGHAVSHGVNDLKGNRNSPALFNMTWSPKLMWDGSAHNLEMQPLGPIQNTVEMSLSFVEAVNRIANSPKYKTLFKKAFGDTAVTSQRMLRAFAQFQGLLNSHQSKYDQVKKGLASFTPDEQSGYALFKSKCEGCHQEPLFSDYAFRNNGLPVNAYQDSGRYKITTLSSDMFCFKTPSLRNLSYSAPYTHDGRFNSLEEVMNFYAGPKASTPNVHALAQSISLSANEKSKLILFLKTLDDPSLISDSRFSEIH